MRLRCLLLLAALACVTWSAAPPCEAQPGCRLRGGACACGFGCKADYAFRSRRACLDTLRERNSNMCSRMPCVRGICIPSGREPGFACKCEGSGYYGPRCEEVCPALAAPGLVFPHECVVI